MSSEISLFLCTFIVTTASLSSFSSLSPASSTSSLATNCPEKCFCLKNKEINCQNKSLRNIPNRLPLAAKKVIMSDNRIRFVGKALQRVHQLIELDLSRNNIREIKTREVFNLASLQVLNLSFNKLTSVPQEIFRYFKHMKTLQLSGNPITSLEQMQFVELGRTLTALELDDLHHLVFLSKSAFSGLFNLKILWMNRCHLNDIPSLESLTNLLELSLISNNIRVIHSEALIGAKQLTRLLLSSNQIFRIEPGAFTELISLKHFDIANNNLTTLSATAFSNHLKISSIRLQSNPWRCDCGLLWLSSYLLENNLCSGGSCPTCQSPKSYRNVSVTNMRNVHPSLICFASLKSSSIAKREKTKDILCKGTKYGSSKTVKKVLSGSPISHGRYKIRVKPLGKVSFNFTSFSVQDSGVKNCSETETKQLSETEDNGFGQNSDNKQTEIINTNNGATSTKKTTSEVDVSNGNRKVINTFPQDNDSSEITTTTKTIIYCFAGLTLFAAVFIIFFYRAKKCCLFTAQHVTNKTNTDFPKTVLMKDAENANETDLSLIPPPASSAHHTLPTAECKECSLPRAPSVHSWITSVSQKINDKKEEPSRGFPDAGRCLDETIAAHPNRTHPRGHAHSGRTHPRGHTHSGWTHPRDQARAKTLSNSVPDRSSNFDEAERERNLLLIPPIVDKRAHTFSVSDAHDVNGTCSLHSGQQQNRKGDRTTWGQPPQREVVPRRFQKRDPRFTSTPLECDTQAALTTRLQNGASIRQTKPQVPLCKSTSNEKAVGVAEDVRNFQRHPDHLEIETKV